MHTVPYLISQSSRYPFSDNLKISVSGYLQINYKNPESNSFYTTFCRIYRKLYPETDINGLINISISGTITHSILYLFSVCFYDV